MYWFSREERRRTKGQKRKYEVKVRRRKQTALTAVHTSGDESEQLKTQTEN